jgi:hypothetical protein
MTTRVTKRNANCTFNNTVNTLETITFNMAAGSQNYFVDTKQSDSIQSIDCIDARTVSAVNAYTDSWGNLNKATVTTTANAKTFVTQTVSVFNTASGQNFLSGLPLSVAITKTDAGNNSLTRTTAFGYETNGLLKSQTVEPDDITLRLTTTYGRDNNVYGLVNKQIQTWTNAACVDAAWMALKANNCVSAMSVVVSDTAYDSKGRFVSSVKNALGQSESRIYDAKSGLPTSHVDMNQLPSYATVDKLGRITSEKTPDENEKRSVLHNCGSNCPNGATVAQVVE